MTLIILFILSLSAVLWFNYHIKRQLSQAIDKKQEILSDIVLLMERQNRLSKSTEKISEDFVKTQAQNKTLLEQTYQQEKLVLDNRLKKESQQKREILDSEIKLLKKRKESEVEEETTEAKKEAVKNLDQWLDQEKSRLQKQLDIEYQRKIKTLEKTTEIEISQA